MLISIVYISPVYMLLLIVKTYSLSEQPDSVCIVSHPELRHVAVIHDDSRPSVQPVTIVHTVARDVPVIPFDLSVTVQLITTHVHVSTHSSYLSLTLPRLSWLLFHFHLLLLNIHLLYVIISRYLTMHMPYSPFFH